MRGDLHHRQAGAAESDAYLAGVASGIGLFPGDPRLAVRRRLELAEGRVRCLPRPVGAGVARAPRLDGVRRSQTAPDHSASGVDEQAAWRGEASSTPNDDLLLLARGGCQMNATIPARCRDAVFKSVLARHFWPSSPRRLRVRARSSKRSGIRMELFERRLARIRLGSVRKRADGAVPGLERQPGPPLRRHIARSRAPLSANMRRRRRGGRSCA